MGMLLHGCQVWFTALFGASSHVDRNGFTQWPNLTLNYMDKDFRRVFSIAFAKKKSSVYAEAGVEGRYGRS